MRKLPPLNAVRMFEAAARHQSLVKAAEELHVTHGAVWRQVCQLEEWFGTALFQRVGRRIELTDDGERFWATAGPALDRLENAAAAIKRRHTASSVSVNAGLTLTTRWLIPRLPRFHESHPKIQIRLGTSLSDADLSSGDYDIAIRLAAKSHPGAQWHRLFAARRMALCSPRLVPEGAIPLTAMASVPLIHTAEGLDYWTALQALAKTPPGTTVKRLHFDQLYFSVEAAVRGDGVVIAPATTVVDDICEGRLISTFLGHPSVQSSDYAIGTLRQGNDAVDLFVAWLQEEGARSEAELDRALSEHHSART
ncbi:LysR substrate-binding domain-containing protein [Ottowia thiooxydans]|uniref:LysR family glycine cleavage system transcriptional activator n=1 Tax=Ottowia thiooxydans TaxID=219182 RepID=A0ABV2Q9Q3_9BURK